MSEGEIKKEDFFNAIKYGHLWQSEKIKEELEKIMDGNHNFRWDSDDKYHYIYDNECYFFIFDKNIEVRCDRDNVFSSHQNFDFEINTDKDIAEAYEKFKSITMEDEE